MAVDGGSPVGKRLRSWCPVLAVGIFHFSRMERQQPGLAWEPLRGDLSAIQDSSRKPFTPWELLKIQST